MLNMPVMQRYARAMDRIIEKLDHGWWVVSLNKNYGCRRENCHMAKRQISSCGSARTTNRRMAGGTCLVRQQQRRHDMGSVRQVIDLDVGCFNWPDEAYNWRSFTDRINLWLLRA